MTNNPCQAYFTVENDYAEVIYQYINTHFTRTDRLMGQHFVYEVDDEDCEKMFDYLAEFIRNQRNVKRHFKFGVTYLRLIPKWKTWELNENSKITECKENLS